MEIKLSGIIETSAANGEGLRKVIFAQGCTHNCRGCFNPDTHDIRKGILCDTEDVVQSINDDFLIDGVTFSGGDPFEQAEAFYEIASSIDVNIWCYTGYTFEYILLHAIANKHWDNLLSKIDVLVDGRFVEELKSDNCVYRGSSNQRIIDVQRSLEEGHIIEYINN